MTRTARSAAAAALAALAAIAAIIAADFAPPASAQGEESGGRIVARLLDDGRVEFGWQPTGGARVLPEKRYFPASVDHNRWLRSSPVEVGGAEIGRINARQLSDGRIEFAFTPTDGERITPRARYFPADARVGRWLRSTEIAIGPAAPGYIAVSAGWRYTCAIRTNKTIACWGDNNSGVTDAPEGRFTAVSAHGSNSCAIRESDGAIECWGYDYYYGETAAPTGSYSTVSVGSRHYCAIRESGEIACWGDDEFGQTDAPAGNYIAVSAGNAHTCAIRESGEIACWGISEGGLYSGQTAAPEGSYSAVSAGRWHTCAIRTSGAIECWGWNDWGQTDAPADNYTVVSAGFGNTCAIRASGELACWGWTKHGSDTPAVRYSAVSASSHHTCAIYESNSVIVCWGLNDYGQATPPTD